ncbi:hypothetical protein JW960_28425 [candidate division KSB1 bacterium]|nr:hypothetical protein [candidate division KSB1 bacterium]
MGTREMFLVLGATVLFGVISFSATSTMLMNKEAVFENENRLTALSIAQQYIEEAKARPYFDAVLAAGVPANLPGGFTAPAGLGHSVSESYPYFNDIDDYDGLTQTVKTSKNEYRVEIVVNYAVDENPIRVVNYQTFYKVMKVNVFFNAGAREDSVQTSMVFGYY